MQTHYLLPILALKLYEFAPLLLIFQLDDSSQLMEPLQTPRADLWGYHKLFSHPEEAEVYSYFNRIILILLSEKSGR